MREKLPSVIWLTGLSGAGKSTIAIHLRLALEQRKGVVFSIDGDVLRAGICSDLGFTEADRRENIRRASHIALLAISNGMITVAALISPTASDREMARSVIGAKQFCEVFVDASVEVCIQRDPKGLYKKALSGQIANFTGISAPYEAPINPDVHINTDSVSVEEAVEMILAHLATV